MIWACTQLWLFMAPLPLPNILSADVLTGNCLFSMLNSNSWESDSHLASSPNHVRSTHVNLFDSLIFVFSWKVTLFPTGGLSKWETESLGTSVAAQTASMKRVLVRLEWWLASPLHKYACRSKRDTQIWLPLFFLCKSMPISFWRTLGLLGKVFVT